MKTIFAFGEWRKVWFNNYGYYCFKIPAKFSNNGKIYNMLVHRWNWMQAYGEIPKGMQIHHKDENKLNNSLDNLEMISAADHNRLHKNKGGGVSLHKGTKKYRARVSQDGKRKHVGTFPTKLEAWHALFEFKPDFWTKEKQEAKLKQL